MTQPTPPRDDIEVRQARRYEILGHIAHSQAESGDPPANCGIGESTHVTLDRVVPEVRQ
jgi:hypothetical protein